MFSCSPSLPPDKAVQVAALRQTLHETREALRRLLGDEVDLEDNDDAEEACDEHALLLSHAERLASMGSWDHDLVKDHLKWSEQLYRILGLDPATFELSYNAFFQLIHPDDRHVIQEGRQRALKRAGLLENEYRIRHSDGSERIIQQRGEVVYDNAGNAIRRRGMVLDVTERKRAEVLAAAQREILEMVIQDAGLSAVLEAIVRLVESRLPGALGSILLLDRDQRLRTGAAPNLPPAYSAGIDGLKIGPAAGSCGTAAARGERVIVSDIATDPLWKGWAETALSHGLRACWSMPIFAREQTVLGTFAIYHSDRHIPGAEEIALVEAISHLAGLAISHQRAEEALRASDLQFANAFEHASIGMALVAIDGRWLKVNRAMCQMLGYSEMELVKGSFQDITHPDDLTADLNLVSQVLSGQIETFQLEKRYFHKSGQIVSCLLSVSLVRDPEDRPVHFISQVQDVTQRKLAEEALRRSEERYRMLFASNPLPMWVYDVKTFAFLAVNSAAVQRYGYSEAEFLGMSIMDIRPAEDAEALRRYVSNLDGDGIDFGVWRHKLKSGEIIDVEVSSDRISFDGRHARLVLANNITARKLAETALRTSESKFRRLADSNVMGIVFCGFQGQVYDANDAYLQMIGYSRNDLLAGVVNWRKLTPPEHAWLDVQAMEELTREGRCTPYEKEYVRKDGRRITIMLGAALLEGEVDRTVCFMIDVTPRKQAEERIAEQAALLDKAQDAILVRSLEQVVQFWNKGAERLYGWTAEEVAGRNVGDFLCHEADKLAEARKVILERGEWSGELLQRTKSGREITVETRWSLLRDSAGQPKSILSINTDITERKKLEAQFLRAQRMESIGTLAGGIAHDLNNVLAPIMMSIDLLRLRISDPVGQETLALISSSARRGAEMVSQVLYFARGIQGERIAIDAKGLLRDLEKFVKETFPKNIVFELAARADLWPVVGDATQVYQVILNLCVNARDAMPDGGRISVAADNIRIDDQLTTGSTDAKPGRFVVFQIQDTGLGMPPEIIDKIFDPFFTTKELGKGTGLGLSTSAAIVRSHGGFLEVSSQPGAGSCFKVYIPATGDAPAGAQPKMQSELPPGSGELILVVDDETSIRHVTGQTLEAFGYRVLTAANGAEALASYDAHCSEVALVLTDMMMPVMDGVELIHALRKRKESLPIIAASGIGGAGQASKAMEAGVRHFIAKPYTAEKLLKVLAAILPG